MQQRVQQHRAVTVRDDEAIAIGPLRIAWVVLEVIVPEHFGDVGHAHRHARMPGIGLLHGVHRQGTNRVGQLPAMHVMDMNRFLGGLCKRRAFWTMVQCAIQVFCSARVAELARHANIRPVHAGTFATTVRTEQS